MFNNMFFVKVWIIATFGTRSGVLHDNFFGKKSVKYLVGWKKHCNIASSKGTKGC